ncbi:hypothetical protein Ddc_17739 [Ditylenchus destructor]|nr:hypothetical protein Ddc_17739 [Ditylenchus destructor]
MATFMGTTAKKATSYRLEINSPVRVVYLPACFLSVYSSSDLSHLWLKLCSPTPNFSFNYRSRSRSPYRGRSRERSPPPRGSPRYDNDRARSRSPR